MTPPENAHPQDVTRICGMLVWNWGANANEQEAAGAVTDTFRGVYLVRWDPAELALPVAPDAARRFRVEPTGFGLALCLDDILGESRKRFDDLERHFCRLFPNVRGIQLVRERAYRMPVDQPEMVPKLEEADGKGIYFQLAGASAPIAAAQASDGMLIVLAYLTLLYLPEPPRVLLVEEPENGVHPKRLEEIVKILRGLIQEHPRTQVVMTTHSPYLVDLFKPEEVTLCRREADGSVSVHRLSESKTVREQMDVFTLGEIWTGEGDDALAGIRASEQEASG